MKNNVIAVAFFCLFFLTLGVKATNVSTDVFKITPIEKASVESTATKAWALNYTGKEDHGFVIEMYNTKKGIEYVVYSDYFEVSYVCCKKGFGVRKVNSEFSKVAQSLTQKVLDEGQMMRQQILTPDKVSESEALGLIASYLPELVKSEYKYLLN